MTETEILIIGGGIAGSSTAYHLACRERSVTLLERGEIASGASGVNAGSIGAMGWGSAPDLQAHLTMGSLELFHSLQLELGCEIEFRASGALQTIHTEAQHAFARGRMLQLTAKGYQLELLTTGEARSLEPELNPALLGFLFWPLWAQAHPAKATQAFAGLAERHGAQVRTGCEVTAIEGGEDRPYNVHTRGESYRAETLVVAAGAWGRQVAAMLGLTLPIVPVRGQMWATDPLPPLLSHTILSAESALQWDQDRGMGPGTPPELTHRGDRRITRHLYGRQTHSGEIVFGGDRQLTGTHEAPDPAGIEVNRHHAAEVIPALARFPIRRTWGGLMPFSLDGAPLIGQIAERRSVYVVGGLGSSGFGRGPMAGKLLAELIHTGQPHPVLAEADPGRFGRDSGS